MKTLIYTSHLPGQLKQLALNFCRCGIAGWCLEIMFTSVDSIMAADPRLMGHTSLLMFPIYGLGALLLPVGGLIDCWLTGLPGFSGAAAPKLSQAGRLVRHGLIFMVLIFTAEYMAGTWLKSLGMCPWDYSRCPDSIDGVIRLKFAPLWFGTGILLETISKKKIGDN